MLKRHLLYLLFPLALQSQSDHQVINPIIQFSNESIHGMLIIHRMLENFNQELNAFVDLQSTKVNFYGNDDLPKNIFEDPENFFYDTSPTEWYKLIKAGNTQNIPIHLIDRMQQNLVTLNQLRFDLDHLIQNSDLRQVANQKVVYEKLELGVGIYDDFFGLQKELENWINSHYTPSNDPLITSFKNLHDAGRNILRGFRNKKEKDIEEGYRKFNSALKGVPQGPANSELALIHRLSKEFNEDVQEYLQSPKVTTAYFLYGYFYYYHNVKIINKFNRYGNGLVYQINEVLRKRQGAKYFLEEPHYFKVVYPAKAEVTPFVASVDSNIAEPPAVLEARKVVVNDQIILADRSQFEFQIFDHKDQDGDILNLNFNGDWILSRFSLSNRPHPVQIQLNKTGKNYLILHAVNVGNRPPNTMAINYFYRGKKRQIILNSDLDTSEMIEIVIDEEVVDLKTN